MRAFTSLLRVVTVVMCGWLLFFAAPAEAQTKVAVQSFSGPSAGGVKTAAVKALQEESSVSVVDDASAADAVVKGQVSRKRRRWSARVSVLGASGDVIESVTFNARSPGALGKSVRTGLWNRLGDAIGKAKGAGGGEAAEAPTRLVPEAEPEAEPEVEAPAPTRSEGKSVVLRSFRGPNADRIHGTVSGELSGAGYQVIDDDAAKSAAAESGADLGTPEGRVAAARSLQASAYVEGRVQKQGRRKLRVQISVYNAADGERAGQATFAGNSAPALNSQVKQRFEIELGEALRSTQVPAPEHGAAAGGATDEEELPPGMKARKKIAQEDEEEPGDEEEEEEPDTGARPSALTVVARFEAFWRSFSYTDDLNDNLLTYSLGPAPYVGLEAQWYPLAHFMSGIPANIGIDGRFGMAIGVESEFQGTKFPTSALDWGIGLRGRYPFGERNEVNLSLGLGGQKFTIDDKGSTPRPELPDVKYTFLRAGLGGLYWLGPLSLRARGAFLLVFSPGTSSEAIAADPWFPHASANGLEGGVEVGYELIDGLEVRLGGELRYFWFSLNPEPSDFRPGMSPAQVAGGASDMYPAITLAISYTLGASSPDAAAPTPAE